MAHTFSADDGAQVRLGKELGRGGEGAVHEVEGRPDCCAKIYIAKALTGQLHDKLKVMAAFPPKDPTIDKLKHHSIAWPTRLLYRGAPDAADFAGFVMPSISQDEFKKAICRFHPGDRRKLSGGDFTWKHAYTSACNISSAVAAIHERGYCIGDINESNILVAGNTLSTLIDCDSFQIRDPKTGRIFRCVVGKGEYTAPELGGKAFVQVDRTPETDQFGLAVLLFQFLMEGCHPYQARGPLVEDAPSTEKKISLGYFPYPHAGRPSGIEPPAYAPPIDILHPEVQKLFLRAFVDGHKAPSARPSSKELFGCLHKLRGEVIQCKANPNHWHFSHLGQCPWCRVKAQKGRDPYPLPGQRTAPPPAQRVIAPRSAKPLLRVSCPSFHYQSFVPGFRISERICVENAGGGALTGSLRSSQKWLMLSRDTLDGAARTQEIDFEIDTTDLAPGIDYSARIDIRTNAGQLTVTVDIGRQPSVSTTTAPSVRRLQQPPLGMGTGFPLLAGVVGGALGAALAGRGFAFSYLWMAGIALVAAYCLTLVARDIGSDNIWSTMLTVGTVGVALLVIGIGASRAPALQAFLAWGMCYYVVSDFISEYIQAEALKGHKARAWLIACLLGSILAILLSQANDVTVGRELLGR